MAADFDITFKPSGRGKAQCEPNPAFPNGVTMNLVTPGAPSCTINLPYPAPECGMWRVKCKRCPFTVWITAAGRVDDPRVVMIACRAKAEAN